ncbi:MAG: zinc-binding dehydrogenase, partial [Salinisphaera sp.]|nr:zinc-binding dehydrogenase [Salinisphaera sp.]
VEAVCTGGHISIIGVLTGMAGEVTTPMLIRKQPRIKAIAVGSRAHQLQLVAALDSLAVKPVIDRRFALEDIADAFRYQESQQHFGKICLTW